MLSGTAQVSHQVCRGSPPPQFCVSSCACDYGRYKQGCRLLFASHWRNCGIPWVNCAVLFVKDDWKGQFWGLRYCRSKLRSLLSFFRQVWLHTVKSLSLT